MSDFNQLNFELRAANSNLEPHPLLAHVSMCGHGSECITDEYDEILMLRNYIPTNGLLVLQVEVILQLLGSKFVSEM